MATGKKYLSPVTLLYLTHERQCIEPVVELLPYRHSSKSVHRKVQMALPHRLPLQLVTTSVTSPLPQEAELAPAMLHVCTSLLREYLALPTPARVAFAGCEHELLSWYGELQYQMRGAGRCSSCRCSVRHALKIRSEREEGSTRTFLCLCTRCMVAEEADAERLLVLVDGHWLEYRANATRRQETLEPAA